MRNEPGAGGTGRLWIYLSPLSFSSAGVGADLAGHTTALASLVLKGRETRDADKQANYKQLPG